MLHTALRPGHRGREADPAMTGDRDHQTDDERIVSHVDSDGLTVGDYVMLSTPNSLCGHRRPGATRPCQAGDDLTGLFVVLTRTTGLPEPAGIPIFATNPKQRCRLTGDRLQMGEVHAG